MRALPVIGVLLVFLSCAGTGYPPQERMKALDKVPVRLEFEQEISGRLLAYTLKRPSGLAFDISGNLFISDAGNHRLIKLDRELKPVKDYGGYGGGIGQFHNPDDIIVDRGLNLYVLDASNRRVIRLDINLNFIEEIIPEDDSTEIISTLGLLSGLQISMLGELTVADYDNSRLIRLDNFNRFSRYIGDFAYGTGALLNPLDLALDREDRLYVADAGNSRIAVYDDYGNYLFQIGEDKLVRPSAVIIAPDHVVWVADEESQDILAFAPDGRFLMQLSEYGKGEWSPSSVQSLALSPNGRLFAADTENNRIIVYQIVYEAAR